MHDYLTRHMVASKDMPYADRQLKAGDPFLATPDDAAYFKLHGKATDAPPEEAKKLTRDEVASAFGVPTESLAPAETAATPQPAPAKRTYTRRSFAAQPATPADAADAADGES